jgi:hypothetical protein
MGLDMDGKPVIWSSKGQQVMMEWEKEYMHQCVDALKISTSDRVLEIGFGLAYSATHIQSFRPSKHVIIECDEKILKYAKDFEATHSSAEIIPGTWQQELSKLGMFECVFFDDYPLPELESNEKKPKAFKQYRSRWYAFLDAVKSHLVPGGRITGYMARDIQFEYPGFDIEMSPVSVQTSKLCDYFPHDTALVPIMTKLFPKKTQYFSSSIFNLQVNDKLRQHVIRSLHSKVERKRCPHQKVQDLRDYLTIQDIPDESEDLPKLINDKFDEKEDISKALASRKAFIYNLRERASKRKKEAIREPIEQ